jgi:hypothetical protein
VAVLVDIDVYEKHFMKPELLELDKDSVDGELMKAAEVAKKSKKKDMLNI